MKTEKSISLKSFAKLNLFLHVLGKRKNGYHSIESVFTPIDWSDEIIIKKTNMSSITREGDIASSYHDDLLVKSAKLLKKYVVDQSEINKTLENNFGCNLFAKKNIPIGSGLGGGSSNAASTLKALNYIWKLNLKPNQLSYLAQKIGADVPFFLQECSCLVSGIGEKLTPISEEDILPNYFVVLAPKINVSTKKIFELYDPIKFSSAIDSHNKNPNMFFQNKKKGFWTYGKNDLQETTCKIYPIVKDLLNLLQKVGGKNDVPKKACRMSGTGGVLFCSVTTFNVGNKIIDEIKQEIGTLNNNLVELKVCKRIVNKFQI